MTREEFESILEEAFLEGYNDAIEEIFDESEGLTYKVKDKGYSVARLNKQKKEQLKDYLKKHTVSLKDLEKAANEDTSFDLEDEMDSYTESKNVKRQMEKFLINKGAKSRVHSYYDIPKKYLDRMQTNRQDPSYDWNDRGGKVDWNIANEKPVYMTRGVNWDKIKERANKKKFKYAPPRGRFQVE